jgi:hypothetical protein
LKGVRRYDAPCVAGPAAACQMRAEALEVGVGANGSASR